MSTGRTVEWYGPDGTALPDGPTAVHDGHGATAAADAEGRGARSTSSGAIAKEAERLQLVSRRGAFPGTHILLPDGVAFERAVMRRNDDHAERLGCEEIHFPALFDGSGAAMSALIRRFDDTGRTYRLSEDPQARLAYAADPSLFRWLQGQRVDLRAGPRFLYSPMLVHKRFRSGEVSVLNLREYLLPDVHALCAVGDRRAALSLVLAEAAAGARALVHDDWLVNADITADLRRRWPGVPTDLVAWTGGLLRLTTRRDLGGYMTLRVGVNASCGAGSVMMYNVQWDETNGPRFDIRDHRGDHVAVVHTTLLGGISKAMPILVGRAQSGLRPRHLPLALAPTQLHLLPVRAEHVGLAKRLGRRLRDRGLRILIVDPREGSVGRRVVAVRRGWGRYVSVLGNDERDLSAAGVRDLSGGGQVAVDAFVRAVAALDALDDRRALPR